MLFPRLRKKDRHGIAAFFSVHRRQYQFLIEHEIFIPKFYTSTPSTEVLFIGLSYALLVVNLKNLEFNIFCLDYFDHDV